MLTTDAERVGLVFAHPGERNVERTRREAGFVVNARCVGLEQPSKKPGPPRPRRVRRGEMS